MPTAAPNTSTYLAHVLANITEAFKHKDICYLPTLALMSVDWLLAKHDLNQPRNKHFKYCHGLLFLNLGTSITRQHTVYQCKFNTVGSVIFHVWLFLDIESANQAEGCELQNSGAKPQVVS